MNRILKTGTAHLISLLSLFSMGNLSAQNETVETIGDVLLITIPATALGSTVILGDTQGMWQFSKSFLLNRGLTSGLKEIINKSRPFDSGGRAFPSGHTSATFQGASFIQRRYGWKYGIPAYVLAGFTGYSRIAADRHDGWDVLAGMVVGVGSTYLFTTPYQREHFELTFSASEGSYMIGFNYKF
ncbi:phosphatase PAP2 family protein [Spongiimicrobium sp. 2-473A-2-J]|uniref:phosphatase PAP2 family protein n=1 Tax=Eudoraea algarum TaxID=3417568 RepID=UPI003D3645D0